MNYNKIFKSGLTAVLLLLAGSLTSCKEDILPGNVDESGYETIRDVYGYVKNVDNPRLKRMIEIYGGKDKAQLYFGLTKAVNKAVDVSFHIDKELLDAYNLKNGSDYEMYPESLVSLAGDGALLMAPGVTRSDPMTLSVTTNSTIVRGKTYVLPIRATTSTEGIKLSKDAEYLYFVKDYGDIPDAAKASGLKTVMYFEVNDSNILNAGEWTLQNSGKPLADIVVIFSGNINYDEASGRPAVTISSNVKAILDKREKYIKPLQDKGIKVTLSILGNHDMSGVANLTRESARDFALQLKDVVDAYGLDGVEFDDEWSEYPSGNIPPAFTTPSSTAFAYLCYETKRLMPDKICSVYHLGKAGFNFQVEGMDPGDFIDFTYEAFYGNPNYNIWSYYKGMTKRQNAPYSRDLSNGMTVNASYLQNVRNEYGAIMLYNFKIQNIDAYRTPLNQIANILYDDNIVWSGKKFEKDY